MHKTTTILAVQSPVTYQTVEVSKQKVTFFQSQFLDLGNSILTWGEAFQLIAGLTGLVAVLFRVYDFFRERRLKKAQVKQ